MKWTDSLKDIIETPLEVITFDFWIFDMEIFLLVFKWNHCLPAFLSLISQVVILSKTILELSLLLFTSKHDFSICNNTLIL